MIEEALTACLIPHKRYLLAVSGGADSICLLHAAAAARSRLSFSIAVAHINHNLRAESADDAAFVASECDKLSVPFFLHVAADPPASNIEAWGRRERYAFFNSLVRDHGFDAVITAHTANDVVETFLMRLFANKELRSIDATDPQRKLLRPFLSIWRADIESYLAGKGVAYRQDASNLDTRFLRNNIRNTILPSLEASFEGNISRILFEQACALSEDSDLLDSFALKQKGEIDRHEPCSRDWLREVKKQLDGLPQGLEWRLVDALFRPLLGFGLGRDWGERLAAFFRSNAPRIELPSRWVVTRKDGGIVVSNVQF